MKEKERDQEKREVQGRSASAVGKAVGIAVGKMMGKTAGYSSENTARNTAADAARRKLGAYVLTAAVWAAGAAATAAGTAAGAAAGLGFGAETVWAAEDRTPIQSIELNIDSDIEAGTSSSHVEITPRGEAHYQVGDIEVLNEEDDWYGGMTPRVSFSLFADHGYYFDGSSRSMFDFYGNNASYVTSRREDDKTTLVVTIKLDKLENGDLSVSGVEWDEGNGSALWEETPGAKYYQVRLYRDDKSVTGIRTTYDTYYEFAGEITRRGDYYFEVRAVGGGSEKGDWYSSDSWYVSSREADEDQLWLRRRPGQLLVGKQFRRSGRGWQQLLRPRRPGSSWRPGNGRRRGEHRRQPLVRGSAGLVVSVRLRRLSCQLLGAGRRDLVLLRPGRLSPVRLDRLERQMVLYRRQRRHAGEYPDAGRVLCGRRWDLDPVKALTHNNL